MAYTVAFETEVPTSRKRKPVEKLAIPLWLEVNLGGDPCGRQGCVRRSLSIQEGQCRSLSGP